jgi:flagellar biosynthesis/type III secretory pathway M-ring protein FliF/YscJ
MDFLNTSFAQLSDLFRSMTVGARIMAGLLLAVVVVSLAWLFQHQMTGGQAYLLDGQSFSSQEMNAMLAAFAKAGLNDAQPEAGRIRIPRSQQAAYVAALAEDNALPVHWGDLLSRTLESSNPFTSQAEREKRHQIAKQQELSNIIKKMDNVANAAVHYDSQKKGNFGNERVATASVVVEMLGSRALSEERVQMIRGMVAACFADLKPEKVTVSDLNHRV